MTPPPLSKIYHITYSMKIFNTPQSRWRNMISTSSLIHLYILPENIFEINILKAGKLFEAQ